jgi:protoporphyrinogen oxidase
MNRSCAVVGGGMLGLTLALHLARTGNNVTVYEAADSPGGLASSFSWGSLTWDRHYHVVLPGDRALLSLLGELGLENEISWHAPSSAFYAGGRMHPFTTTLDHLRFPVISLADKYRLWSMVRRAQRTMDWQRLSREPVESWLRREGGDRVFERVWRPLLRAKLGDAYRDVSASFIWATIQRLYGNGLTEPPKRFGYLRCGYAGVIDRLVRALTDLRVRIECGSPVRQIAGAANGMLAVHTDSATRVYDRIVATIPAPHAAKLCLPLSDEERDRLRAIAYQGVVCASVVTDRPLGNAYITNIADDSIPFTAAIDMSALCGTVPFDGRHVMYLPRYCTPQDPLYTAGDAALRDRAFAALAQLYPQFSASSVRAFRVSRVPAVFALPTIEYFGRVPGFSTSRRGLYLATSAQIVNGTLNVNETLGLASRAALHISTDPRFLQGAIHEAAG